MIAWIRGRFTTGSRTSVWDRRVLEEEIPAVLQLNYLFSAQSDIKDNPMIERQAFWLRLAALRVFPAGEPFGATGVIG